ncbi:OmpA family protein [Pseudogemmobacter humi]|uniref:Flagellar motor protein MotB n=1 Tax=Pseudogemmobacter humi TaxID=2483812 RepID=A0A3P5XN35_9RHOB|nr:OmpA family protein [Pseudogemmobacter humi]VDC33151.1 flagellar motor protein MotB [Pseudogemmobacter humi]
MRKILISSTALSVALSSFHTMPARAQVLQEDGSVLGPDGAVICTPTAEMPCDLDAILRAMNMEADAALEAGAAEEAAAEAEVKAAADEAARAEAEAAAAAEAAEAEAKAAADEAERAAAEAAAQAEAEAQAEAQAAAEAAAAAQAEAEEAARIAAEEAAQAAEAAAKAAAEAEAAPEAGAEPSAEADEAAVPATGAQEEAAEETAPAVDEAAPAGDAAPDAATTEEPAADPSAEPAETTTTDEPEGQPAAAETPADEPLDSAAAAPEEPVDAPVPEAQAVETLSTILTAPESVTGGADGGIAAGVAAAAALLDPSAAGAAAEDGTAAEAPPASAPVGVIESVIDEATARTSAEEFAAAPVAVGAGKKSGLSDLEKVGLVALGALVVGAVINEGRKDQKKVVSNSGDRVVVENPDGSYVVYKDDDAVLRRPGVSTRTESYSDGSTRTVVSRADGSQVVTVRDASGRVLKRTAYDRQGIETVLIDDLWPEEPIIVTELPRPAPDRVTISTADSNAALKAELAALEAENLGRKFSLRQIREIREVRALAATVEVDSITFDTGSSVIRSSEARKLADLGRLMQQLLGSNPRHVFLIEGHTDAVGSASSNLLLSDRRAESLALALTEYFGVPPENLVVQGYGESELKIASQGDERANRRVVVRLITPLMRTAALQ